MRYEAVHEMEMLKEKLEKGKMETERPNNFIDEDEYEDEYSGNEIYEIQADFFYHAKKYLQENYKGQYAIIHGTYCVHIVSLNYLNNRCFTSDWTIC